MQSIEKQLNLIVTKAFEDAGVPADHAGIKISDRPELADYQCNGAMAAAKPMHMAPREIASKITACFDGGEVCEDLQIAGPGFLNIRLKVKALAALTTEMLADGREGVEPVKEPKRIVVDYGGPNVAKPLHVGHLRAAIIGEAIKRMLRFEGHEVAGDIHMGDWGYQMGLIIASMEEENPDLSYFTEEQCAPEEIPFTLSDLERIYPEASARAKEDEAFRERALEATHQLQNGKLGYRALWKHIMELSVTDLKKNYANLNVHFDWWKGESDVQDLIAPMVEDLKEKGYAYLDDGALIVDVSQPDDKKEIPPCMILKSDGSALYATTDLATLLDRENCFKPDQVIYVVDKRQGLHFTQVFRCAKKTGIVPEETELDFLGFGTMNGEDGQPYKTREGGVMRLADLIQQINDYMYGKVVENQTVSPEEAKETAGIIALAALKYGDLSNQASKDYVFSIERFASFDGNTGPYLLYTIVRIKSILEKNGETGTQMQAEHINCPEHDSERALMLELIRFPDVIAESCEALAPHRLCAYLYKLAGCFNAFYRDVKILSEPDEQKKSGYIALLKLTRKVMERGIDLLGFEAPDRM